MEAERYINKASVCHLKIRKATPKKTVTSVDIATRTSLQHIKQQQHFWEHF
jgi:hypothetical protein